MEAEQRIGAFGSRAGLAREIKPMHIKQPDQIQKEQEFKQKQQNNLTDFMSLRSLKFGRPQYTGPMNMTLKTTETKVV